MERSNIIKSIVPHACPHCNKDIYIESSMVPMTISSIFTKEDVEKAKHDLLERVKTITIDDEKRESVVKWINDPMTVFGPQEVENIVLSLLNPEE